MQAIKLWTDSHDSPSWVTFKQYSVKKCVHTLRAVKQMICVRVNVFNLLVLYFIVFLCKNLLILMFTSFLVISPRAGL